MNFDLDSGKLVVFVGGLLLFLLVETCWPARPWRTSSGAEYAELRLRGCSRTGSRWGTVVLEAVGGVRWC